MKNLKRYRPFEEKFLFLSDFIEKILYRTFLFILIALVISQILLTFDVIRKWIIPVEILESTFYLF